MNTKTMRVRLLSALCELDEGPDCDPTGAWQIRCREEVRAALAILDDAEVRRIFPLIERDPDVRSGKKQAFRFIHDPDGEGV